MLKQRLRVTQALQAELEAARQQAELAGAEGEAARAAQEAEGAEALAAAGRREEELTRELELARSQVQEQESARKAEAEQRRVDDAEAMRVREELGAVLHHGDGALVVEVVRNIGGRPCFGNGLSAGTPFGYRVGP